MDLRKAALLISSLLDHASSGGGSRSSTYFAGDDSIVSEWGDGPKPDNYSDHFYRSPEEQAIKEAISTAGEIGEKIGEIDSLNHMLEGHLTAASEINMSRTSLDHLEGASLYHILNIETFCEGGVDRDRTMMGGFLRGNLRRRLGEISDKKYNVLPPVLQEVVNRGVTLVSGPLIDAEYEITK